MISGSVGIAGVVAAVWVGSSAMASSWVRTPLALPDGGRGEREPSTNYAQARSAARLCGALSVEIDSFLQGCPGQQRALDADREALDALERLELLVLAQRLGAVLAGHEPLE